MTTSQCLARHILHALMVSALGAAAIKAAEPDRDGFATVAARARRVARASQVKPAERATVLAALAGHDTPEAASLIAAVGFTAADPATRIAARTSLVARAADPATRSHLLADWRRQSKRPGPVTAELSLVLLAAEAEHDRGEFRELLDTMPRAALLTWLAAICDTAVQACDATAIAAVRSLASLRCFSASLACRRGVIETLTRMREPEAITALVDILEGLRGEARGDVVRHLAAVSGKQLGTDVEGWRTWFAAHGDAAGPMPPAEATTGPPPPPSDDPDASQANYYDIPIYADRVVFVLDTSGSMLGPRLEAAKRELESAIMALPAETEFAVVFFNSGAGSWRRMLVEATDQNKRDAVTFVARLPAEGTTATSDALQAAFTFDTEAIFLLSDGEPSAGRIVDPAGIIQFVKELNRGRAVTVNTIGIMTGGGFLDELAKANHGTFRAVAE